MGASGDREVIGAGIKDVGLRLGVVIGSEVFGRDFDVDDFARMAFDGDFGGVEEVDGALFDEVGLVIVGVGEIDVKLSQELRLGVGVVGDSDFGGDVAVFGLLDVDAFKGLGVVVIA